MKIGIFTDSHYSSAEITCGVRYNSRSLEKIRDAMACFDRGGCDLAVCLGDLIDCETEHAKEIENLQAVTQVLDTFVTPCICVMGNHDAFAFRVDEFYGILGEGRRPHVYSKDGKHLVFIDACHFRSGAHYTPGDTDWQDTGYPDEEGLRNMLDALDGEVMVMMHQNIDPAVSPEHCLWNADAIRRILQESGKVKRVFQGHFHPGKESVHEGIAYVTYPAMVERENAWFVLQD